MGKSWLNHCKTMFSPWLDVSSWLAKDMFSFLGGYCMDVSYWGGPGILSLANVFFSQVSCLWNLSVRVVG